MALGDHPHHALHAWMYRAVERELAGLRELHGERLGLTVREAAEHFLRAVVGELLPPLRREQRRVERRLLLTVEPERRTGRVERAGHGLARRDRQLLSLATALGQVQDVEAGVDEPQRVAGVDGDAVREEGVGVRAELVLERLHRLRRLSQRHGPRGSVSCRRYGHQSNRTGGCEQYRAFPYLQEPSFVVRSEER